MSDVFGRRPGDERLDAEVSAALAARVHHRSRVSVWLGRLALAASLLLMVATGALAVVGADPGVVSALVIVAIVMTVASVAIVALTARRTRRLLEASAPEGGVVLGMSAAGINLTHLPLLEWSAVEAIGIATRQRGAVREVAVGIAVADVDAVRARIIDARLLHLVRPFPRRSPAGRPRERGGSPSRREPGFLVVELGDLLGPEMIDEVIRRLELESGRREIPLHRAGDRRRLGEVLRPAPS